MIIPNHISFTIGKFATIIGQGVSRQSARVASATPPDNPVSIFSRLYGGAMAVLKMSSSILAWGDNSVSSCVSHSRAKGPGTSAGAFPVHSMARFLVSRLYGGAMAVLKMSSSLLAWGDNSVSSCRSHSRAKGPGTSAGASSMDMARSL